ncbi:helix-turn-helix transcriptional regulator [Kribbella sp. NBC_01245]|uniref:helix-turn-helix transcriptional regulator n=1 Tax=Kribbella sp. NBC_01245 TaxID=2903578 RepID=UPI002E2B1522|nr:helix-turn-helix transcriptional regulator [Kribbella sp. NBC_01245]
MDVLSADTPQGRVYRALIAHPRSTVPELADLTGMTPDEVERLLVELSEAEAVTKAGAGWDAQRPDLLVAAALLEEDRRRMLLRQTEAELAEIYRFARREHGGYAAVEVLDETAVVFEHYRRFQTGARQQVRNLDRPPYFWDEEELAGQEKLQIERMAAGIRYRTIYQESAQDSPRRSAGMMRTVASGERARVMVDPPIKLAISDDRIGLLPMETLIEGNADSLVTLLIHASGLLTALSNIFESLWRLAVPVTTEGFRRPIDERDREILTLMASGATDDAIARHLGMSRRTVVRRAASLLERLGATTRFQAGVQASRRGWL